MDQLGPVPGGLGPGPCPCPELRTDLDQFLVQVLVQVQYLDQSGPVPGAGPRPGPVSAAGPESLNGIWHMPYAIRRTPYGRMLPHKMLPTVKSVGLNDCLVNVSYV